MENKRGDAKKDQPTGGGITDKEINEILQDADKKLKGVSAGRSPQEQKTSTPPKKNSAEKSPAQKNSTEKQFSQMNESEFPEPYVDTSLRQEEKERITIGRIIGTVLEFVWTVFKLTVVIGIVTIVVGFFLSRELMIRGRNGNRQALSSMYASQTVTGNKASEDARVKEWLARVKREKITLEADDKSILVARKIVTDPETDQWAVILHGYNGSMEDVYDIAMHYVEEGYNVLTPDLRGNGESEGMFLGMGWLDRLDVINWIDVILAENPSAKIVIHGVDMGADAALMLSGEPVKSSIKAIVAEGAYNNAWDVVKEEYELRHEKWPVFPFLYMMNPVMKVWAGYTLKQANAVKQVERTSIPILLIHGAKDTYESDDMTTELNQAIASTHEVCTIQTGTHEDCRYAEPENYYQKTFDFANRYVR